MEIIVSSTGSLISALRTAQSGDTILLSPGSYSTIGLQGVSFSGSGVTITSADAANPATVAGVELSNCSGLTFSNLEVTINARTQTAFNVGSSSNIHLDGLDMHGPAGAQNAGLLFRSSTNVSVNDTDFHDLGTAVRNVDSSYVVVSGNRFEDIQGDGIQTTGTSNITITGNYLTDFHTSPGDHPDAIQFFTVNQTAPVHDIVISNNVVVRGSGDIVQGIFMGNEADLPYVDVTISGNKIVGAMYNGIAIGMGQNLSITGNIVQAYADMGSWIRVEGSSNATIADNQSSQIQYDKGNVGVTLYGNTTLAATKVGDLSLVGDLGVSGLMRGTADADTLVGGSREDQLWGGAGNDSLAGGEGVNLLRGEEGADTLAGGSRFDDMHGNAGDDILYGFGGGDWVVGGQGNDNLYGGAGDDLIYGQLGMDICDGGDGADILTGGQSNDLLLGGGGADYLSGDRGDDTLTGGSGADTFHTFGEAGLDRVTDFNAAEGDRVLLDAGALYSVAQAGADTVITIDGGATMVLVGVNSAALQPGWIFGA